MTREQAKQVLIGMGVSEPSDEQVTKYLDSIETETKKIKERSTSLKEKADKAEALEKELEDLRQQNMTEAEKQEAERQKEKAAVDKEIADLKTALAESNRKALASDITSVFVNAGLSSKTYASVIKAYASMPYEKSEYVMKEVDDFVKEVSEANKVALETAKATWEKETLDSTPNPGGGNDSREEKEKSAAAEFAQKYSARMNPETKPADDNAPANF